jgi:hypothetical protein
MFSTMLYFKCIISYNNLSALSFAIEGLSLYSSILGFKHYIPKDLRLYPLALSISFNAFVEPAVDNENEVAVRAEQAPVSVIATLIILLSIVFGPTLAVEVWVVVALEKAKNAFAVRFVHLVVEFGLVLLRSMVKVPPFLLINPDPAAVALT